MLYNEGQLVQWRKWIGKIHFAVPENKSYVVILYGYKGFQEMNKQIDQRELCELK